MPLTWDMRECPNKDTVDSGTRETMIFATMFVGMGQITEDNWKQFASRLQAWEKCYGPLRWKRTKSMKRQKEIYFTLDEVHLFVGLKTNVGFETRAQFRKKLADGLEREYGRF